MNITVPKASIVIPLYNRGDAIGLTLEALSNQTLDPAEFEVIVVDDGSSDGSMEIIEGLSLPFALRIAHQQNRGAGAARNRGASLAAASLLVFLDADMVAAADIITQYLAAHTVNPDALVIGRQRPWTAAYGSTFDHTTQIESFRDLGPEPFKPEFYHIMSSSMALSRDWFESLGGFNGQVGVGSQPATDDTEFAYRAQLGGLDLVYWPAALAYHNHPRTFAQRCEQTYVTAFWTARLFQRYPEIQQEIPVFRDVMPVRWEDNTALKLQKVQRILANQRPFITALMLAIRLLEHHLLMRPLLLRLYWAALGAYRYSGYKAGSVPVDADGHS